MIVGFCGFIGSGKTTAAQYLEQYHGFTRMSFATTLKDVVASAFQWDRERLDGVTKSSRVWRDQPDLFWSERFGRPITPRYVLQWLGTGIFREQVLDSFWVDNVVLTIQKLSPNANIVFDDARFINERQALRKLGAKFITVVRPSGPYNGFPTADHAALWQSAHKGLPVDHITATTSLHPSEWEWMLDPTFPTDMILSNTMLADFYNDIDAWYNSQYVPPTI